MNTNRKPPNSAVSDLAQSLDCLTEGQLCALGRIKPGTAEAWRKRGTGPEYIRFGNEFLYPRKPLAEFLQERARGRSRVTPSNAL